MVFSFVNFLCKINEEQKRSNSTSWPLELRRVRTMQLSYLTIHSWYSNSQNKPMLRKVSLFAKEQVTITISTIFKNFLSQYKSLANTQFYYENLHLKIIFNIVSTDGFKTYSGICLPSPIAVSQEPAIVFFLHIKYNISKLLLF